MVASINQLRDQSIKHPKAIELLEAAQSSENTEVKNALKKYNQEIKKSAPLKKWLPALHGGDAARGKKLVQQHCSKCHQGTPEANQLGPDLAGVTTRLNGFRRDLLAALVTPSATIAPGYGNVTVEFKQGQVTGKILAYETAGLIIDIKNQARLVYHSDYTNLSFEKSTMPAAQDSLTMREIRDVVSYLNTLVSEPDITKIAAVPFSLDELNEANLETGLDIKPLQKRLYEANCAACHQSEGKGNQGFPPLAKSEWVSGDKDTLIKMQLLGLSGPIKVRGKVYDGVPMPSSAHLKDAEIAHILTYIRTNPLFENNSSAIFEEEIVETRATIADQKGPLDASTLTHPNQPAPNKTPQKKQDNESMSYLGYIIGFIILCLIPVAISFVRNNKPTTK